MALGGMLTKENDVRSLEVAAVEKGVEHRMGDGPKSPWASNEHDPSGVLARDTPRERGGSVLGPLGDESSRLTGGAVDVSCPFPRPPVGFGGFARPLGGDLFGDRKPALRARRCAVGHSVIALRTLDEHAGT